MGLIRRLRQLDLLFQLHWFVGITAGAVLAVVGVTGGLMSFEQDILEWINTETTQRLERDTPRLTPPELLARYRRAHPEREIDWVFWRGDRPYPMLIAYRTPDSAGQRATRDVVDPFTAEPLPPAHGQTTFGLIRSIHRRLAAGAVGQFIVGVATIALVGLSITGLWIRWQRRPRQGWRWVWPRALGGKRAGEWHAVLGLWALAAYLIAALTGLWWSFDWYRDGARALFASHDDAAPILAAPAPGLDLDSLWRSLAPRVADARSVFIRFPDQPTDAVAVRSVPADAAHVYAADELFLHPSTGAVLGFHPFADLAAGDQLLASVYALHMGAFFGLPGIVLMMLASLSMPVFFVTGLLLYLRRRRMKRRVTPVPLPRARHRAEPGTAAVLIAYASQSGLAQRVAAQTADALHGTGRPVRMAGLGELTPACLSAHRQAMFVVSTHGDGDAPVAARRFDRHLCATHTPSLEQLDYALLALGDTDYGDSYCAFGRRLDRALRERGARTLLAPIEVDKGDQQALAEWHGALTALFGAAVVSAEPVFERWRLVERRILNPDSLGAPTAWLRLVATESRTSTWLPGDIAEIRPRQPATRIRRWLGRHGLVGAAAASETAATPLIEALSDRQLPDSPDPNAADMDWNSLPPLAPRDYSIANHDTGHGIELLVRLARHDGGLGLASGWLVERAPVGGTIDLRLRANPGFRAPPASRSAPAIFIGNGTGLAGLRAHLQQRIAAGQRTNWLVFGERQRQADFYFADEINAWHAAGQLTHLDLAFSRDKDDGRYVQTVLAEHAERVRDWVEHGAQLFVCGSHDGMAPGVTAALVDALGAAALSELDETGRLHIDVY
ncbi:sulfite reductase flavoprotein subunit alpha [Salinisphaera sp. T31B1]|uniref:sulfite reductase flavoprotein subunit alpha n=1 Tax=Salinisphaera sp. T31B1 TaxID=727963 RepID=UPI00333F428C